VTLKQDYLVEKRNVLNEIRANSMSLQELRFFSIYLARINPRDINTRLVRFSLEDFQKIIELGKLNMHQLSQNVNSLLCKVVGVPREDGGIDYFQLFKKCTIAPDVKGEWYIEIDAHDDALPLMFEFKERYFTYELWNALRLKSSNQLRMYEILKQYEKIGFRVISLSELRALLGIGEREYARFGDFKNKVLDVCRRALEDNTDIKFTCEPTGKRGKGGKVFTLRFEITRNENYVDKISLTEFITQQEEVISLKDDVIESDDSEQDGINGQSEGDYFEREMYPFLAEACDNEFNSYEIQVLYNLIIKIVLPVSIANRENWQMKVYDYLKHKYDELKWRASLTEINNRMGYLKKIIESDLQSN
jgi:plasmid replication initiation protein